MQMSFCVILSLRAVVLSYALGTCITVMRTDLMIDLFLVFLPLS